MHGFQRNTCPHCGKSTLIDIDARYYQIISTHALRQPLDTLPPRAFQRYYFCDTCQNSYFVTVTRKPKPKMVKAG